MWCNRPATVVENLFDPPFVHVGDKWDTADVGGLMGQASEIITRDVVQRELPASAHELAQALAEALVVGVEAKSAGGYPLEFFVAQFLAKRGGGNEDLVFRVPEALDVHFDRR